MRIVAGKYRHRIIDWPGDEKITRPTKDRIREAIFSAIGNIEGLTSLDLYAGSGAMGIESLSRGCKYSIFVDSSILAYKTIKNNLSSLLIKEEEYKLYHLKDIDALEKISKAGQKIDLLFLDPPYQEGKYEDIIQKIIDKNLLNKDAIIICESDKSLNFSDNIRYSKYKEYKYGPIYVTILWR